ncbi:hypothetical protein [Aromatoleum diolicum]|nr:hypothetical protein [Aromatoleum diolicum]
MSVDAKATVVTHAHTNVINGLAMTVVAMTIKQLKVEVTRRW